MKNVNKFNNDIKKAIEESKKVGYYPVRLIQMLQKVDYDAYELVPELVKKEITDGFTNLIMKGKKELTIEAIVLKHKNLFSEDIIKICEKKLNSF